MTSLGRNTLLAGIVAVACVSAHGAANRAFCSDHQDTPEVEINQRCDVNDVYAFPSPSNSGRICLIMTTSSPLTPPESPIASFSRDKLYQIKIDNTGDAVEDLVFQFTFQGTGPAQQVSVRGPVAPVTAGRANRLSGSAPALQGAVNQVLGSGSGLQAFCGLKDDPFFIDLEQFFRIVPDRRPAHGPLATPNPIDPPAWRPEGEAVDYLAGLNCLAIAVELPASQLAGSLPGGRIGVWGTISR